jgi:hypothetical protein
MTKVINGGGHGLKRILLILDGTDQLESALAEVQHICDPGDKLTVLAVAEKPGAEVLGMAPRDIYPEPLTGPGGSVAARIAPDAPVLEATADTESRVAGELRDALDARVAKLDKDGVDIWTQAIVRDEPAEAVAEYARASGFAEVAVSRKSLDRLHELLTDKDGSDVLDGSIAPVILLPG